MLTATGNMTAVDRIQVAQPTTLYAEWELGGDAADPGPVVVTIFSDRQGQAIITGASTTGAPGPVRSISLAGAQLPNLDLLTLTWTAADGSMQHTYAEVVGGFLFSLGRARRLSPLQDASMYPTDALLDCRTLAETALEDICGVAFVPRYQREEMTIEGYGVLSGARRKITSVQQITTYLNGQQVPLTTLAGLQIINGTSIFLPALWSWVSQPIFCSYEHGYRYPPPRVSNAALLLARRWAVESPWDERATGFRTRDGGEMTILTASHSDPFDIPEVMAVADAYGMPAVF